jgi:micrococcal nuclease
MMSWPLYHYRATCTHVVDGDPADFDIDFGDHIHRIERCRFLGINCDELHDPDPVLKQNAERAKIAVATLLLGTPAPTLYIKTDLDKDDKYGRLLVTIYTAADAEKSLNRQLVEWNLATPYIGWERV